MYTFEGKISQAIKENSLSAISRSPSLRSKHFCAVREQRNAENSVLRSLFHGNACFAGYRSPIIGSRRLLERVDMCTQVSMQVKDFRIRSSLKLDLYDFPTIDLLCNLRASLLIVVCVLIQICKTYVTKSMSRRAKSSTYCNGLLTKHEVNMAGYCPNSLFSACLWTGAESMSINTQIMNDANIQPSRPHKLCQ